MPMVLANEVHTSTQELRYSLIQGDFISTHKANQRKLNETVTLDQTGYM